MAAAPLRVVVAGLGKIGRGVLAAVAADPRFTLVGCADPAPALAGRDAGDPAIGGPPGLRVAADPSALLASAPPAVVFLATGSRAAEVVAVAEACLGAGSAVVSSCEELACPWLHPAERDRLAAAAATGGGRWVATGVNPGFVFDALAALLVSATLHPRRIEASRVVDSLSRRPQLRQKTGAGRTPAEFAAGSHGHVGLRESAALLLRALGHDQASVRFEETLVPVLAEQRIETPEGSIAPGHVAGVRQTVIARDGDGDGERVRLDLVIAAGARDPGDRVWVDGDPPLALTIPGGVPGESATVARMLAAARPLLALDPGVWSVLDLAIV